MTTSEQTKETIKRIKESLGSPENPILLSDNLSDIRSLSHVNHALLEFRHSGAWQDFVAILVSNGYEVNCKLTKEQLSEYKGLPINKEVIEITWKDRKRGLNESYNNHNADTDNQFAGTDLCNL